jgi:ABC-type multidrug transport system fused ATPase/permease subunit
LKYILLIVLFLIGLTVFFITQPQPDFKAGKQTAESKATESETLTETTQPEPEVEAITQKRQEMEVEFEKLKKARRTLELRLARLKAILWGKEIPKEERDAINEEMKNGHQLLKNKKLMGAYSDVAAIRHELTRVEYISEYLRQVEEKYRSERSLRSGVGDK